MGRLWIAAGVAVASIALVAGAVGVGSSLQDSGTRPALHLTTFTAGSLARSSLTLTNPPAQSPLCAVTEAARERRLPIPDQSCPIGRSRALAALSPAAQSSCPPRAMCALSSLLIAPHTDRVLEAQLADASSSRLVQVGQHRLVWAIAVRRQFGGCARPPQQMPAGPCPPVSTTQLLQLVDARSARLLVSLAPA